MTSWFGPCAGELCGLRVAFAVHSGAAVFPVGGREYQGSRDRKKSVGHKAQLCVRYRGAENEQQQTEPSAGEDARVAVAAKADG